MSNTHSTLLGRAIQQLYEFRDYIKTYVQEELSNACPIGTVRMWSGKDLPSSKWVWIRGQTLQKSLYPKLFQVLGVDSPTFTLPNTIDSFPEGSNPGSFGQTINPGLPNITGDIATESAFQGASGAFYHWYTPDDGGFWGGDTQPDGVKFDASRCSAIYGASNTVQPKAFRIAYILRAI